MAGERANMIGAAVPRFGVLVGGSPARAVVAAAAAFVAARVAAAIGIEGEAILPLKVTDA
jgi:hypothetical protein